MEQWRAELYHSSGPWKKHKYIRKKGEGKNAIYYYKEYKKNQALANSAGERATLDYYTAQAHKANGEFNKDSAQMKNKFGNFAAKSGLRDTAKNSREEARASYRQAKWDYANMHQSIASYKKNSADYERYNKAANDALNKFQSTVLGNIYKRSKAGKKLIDMLFK